ncbi:type IV pilus twitching motility protein PilT [Microbacterium sp. TNHR37B]|uniref:type IV pilus twitching motility protein PilT n=1 Tax=Microbacterium sp. TNHR37B TaxID=1775956 RepID=UPI0007B302A8|nr:type IV pilus twitching motility protein PilT [Microbacterium sp. TNHR37B]KZE90647.1 Twitching mobility protein [Microbacterium sp. TNHR37B]
MIADTSPLDALLRVAADLRASDVHLTANHPPQIRIDGDLALVPGFESPTSANWLESAIGGILTTEQVAEFRASGEVDLSITVPEVARFRVNVFRQLGQVAVALRFIPERIKSFEELGVPRIAAELVMKPRGLVLVTGPTGSGKSTTLASMIDVVNRSKPAHIVTVEDPVEFQHTSKRALIHQREIGSDTASFSEALRRVLRQDPDIILIGELRDQESISTALTAAETGHLVLSTLHTQSAAKSINRIVDAFPSDQQNQIRTQLGDTLRGIITQTLLPKAQSEGRVIATEVLVNSPAIANLIREGEISQIYSMLQAGGSVGMHTLDQDLQRLVADGSISLTVAREIAEDPRSFDETKVRPADYDAEAWTMHASERSASGWGL